MTGVYVNGQNLASLGYVGGLRFSHQWPGGCWDAAWSMGGLSRTTSSSLLKQRGAEVRIYVGTARVWRGVLEPPDDGMTAFSARGYYREAERFLALDTGVPTTVTADAITEAIADGWDVTYTGTPPTGIATDQPQYLHQLLDTASTAAEVRWGVNAMGELFFAADPTTPTLLVTPGQPLMGGADDSYASHLYAEYVSAVSGTPPVPSATGWVTATDADAAASFGRSAFLVDLKPRGYMPTVDAQAIVDGMLAKGKARIGFTAPMTLGWHQLLTMGGVPANPATVTAGQMVRVYGAVNPDGSPVAGGTQDLVIGGTSHEAGSRTITLSPVGLQPRNLSDVLAVTPLAQEVA